MALTWDLSEIEDYKNVCWIKTEPLPSEGEVETDEDGKVERLSAVTETLIYLSISTGIGTITEKNAGEVFARIRIIEKLHGPMMHKQGEAVLFKPEDVIAHIGLVTNASYKDQTRAQFFKQISEDMNRNKQKVETLLEERATA